MAANIDTVLLTDAVDGFLTTRHLERYLALAWQSGVGARRRDHQGRSEGPRAGARAPGVGAGSGAGRGRPRRQCGTGEGIDQLAPYLAPGRTVTLLGLSGAGKSTLVNLLAGEELLDTGAGQRRWARAPHHDPPPAGGPPRRRRAHRHAGHAGPVGPGRRRGSGPGLRRHRESQRALRVFRLLPSHASRAAPSWPRSSQAT